MQNISEKYVVLNDNTLCHRQEGSEWLGVLAGNIHGRDWRNGPALPGHRDVLKPATVEDFDRFRVMLPRDFPTAAH